MQADNPKNLLKKALIITGITSAGLFLSFPTLASEFLAQSSGSGSTNRTDSIDRNNVDTGDRNTSPEVNREQNRPGTGTESDTRQNLTGPDDAGAPNRIYQNRTGNQNSPNDTNNNNNNYNRSNPTDNQNIRNNNNSNPQSGNQNNNRSYNTDGSEAGAVQGLW